jgi:hypothetical protein
MPGKMTFAHSRPQQICKIGAGAKAVIAGRYKNIAHIQQQAGAAARVMAGSGAVLGPKVLRW